MFLLWCSYGSPKRFQHSAVVAPGAESYPEIRNPRGVRGSIEGDLVRLCLAGQSGRAGCRHLIGLECSDLQGREEASAPGVPAGLITGLTSGDDGGGLGGEIYPALAHLPGANEDARAGRGRAVPVNVELGDVAVVRFRGGQTAKDGEMRQSATFLCFPNAAICGSIAHMNRRAFLLNSAASGGSLLLAQAAPADTANAARKLIEPASGPNVAGPGLPDLSPAHWIWFPSGRTLPNTFILFRRTLQLAANPRRATGWVCADSRYRLEGDRKSTR